MSRATRLARWALRRINQSVNYTDKKEILKNLWLELSKKDPTFYLNRGIFGRSAEVSELYDIAKNIVENEIRGRESEVVRIKNGLIWRLLMPTVKNNSIGEDDGSHAQDLPNDERELIIYEGDQRNEYFLNTIGSFETAVASQPNFLETMSELPKKQFLKKESWSSYFNRKEANFKREAFKFIALSMLTVGAYPVFYVMNKSLTALAFGLGKLVKACSGWTYADIEDYKKYPLSSSNETSDNILVKISPVVAWVGYLFVGWVLSPIFTLLHTTIDTLLNPVKAATWFNEHAKYYAQKLNRPDRPYYKYKWFFHRVASILVIPTVLAAYAALIVFAAPAVAGLLGAAFGSSNVVIATALTKMSAIFPQFYLQAGQFLSANVIAPVLAKLGVLAYSGVVDGMAMIGTMLVTAKVSKMLWQTIKSMMSKFGSMRELHTNSLPQSTQQQEFSPQEEFDEANASQPAPTFSQMLAQQEIPGYLSLEPRFDSVDGYVSHVCPTYVTRYASSPSFNLEDFRAAAAEHAQQGQVFRRNTMTQNATPTPEVQMHYDFENIVNKVFPYDPCTHKNPMQYAKYVADQIIPKSRAGREEECFRLQQGLIPLAQPIYANYIQSQQIPNGTKRPSSEFSFTETQGSWSPTMYARGPLAHAPDKEVASQTFSPGATAATDIAN